MSRDLYRTEQATWERCKARLLREHPGRFALIRGRTVVAIHDTEDAAIEDAYARWGYGPIFVQPIVDPEPVEYLPLHDLSPWRS